MKKITENVKLAGYDELFRSTQEDLADSKESQVVEIPVKDLHAFKNHPFKVLDDEEMDAFVESIKAGGILHPVIARVRPEGGYELISGHRRHRACELAGIETMPVIVRNLSNEEATVAMVDANLQRERILISEKARAYAMKYQAEKRQGKSGGYLLDEMSEDLKESRKQIQRYIWISRLLDELLDLVDGEKLGFCQGVDISFLTEEEQAWVLLVIKMGQINVTGKQSATLKKLSKEHMLNFEMVQEVLKKPVIQARKFSLSEKKLAKYFDNSYTNERIEELIIRLLEEWKESNGYGSTQE